MAWHLLAYLWLPELELARAMAGASLSLALFLLLATWAVAPAVTPRSVR